MEQEITVEKMDKGLKKDLRRFYANEKLGFEVYKRLSRDARLTPENSELLNKIAELEKKACGDTGKVSWKGDTHRISYRTCTVKVQLTGLYVYA